MNCGMTGVPPTVGAIRRNMANPQPVEACGRSGASHGHRRGCPLSRAFHPHVQCGEPDEGVLGEATAARRQGSRCWRNPRPVVHAHVQDPSLHLGRTAPPVIVDPLPHAPDPPRLLRIDVHQLARTNDHIRPERCPFDAVFRLFQHGESRHDLMARTADRAVLIELTRLPVMNHVLWASPDKREVGSSNLPRPIASRVSRLPSESIRWLARSAGRLRSERGAPGLQVENPRCISVCDVRSRILRRGVPCRGARPRGCVRHGGRTVCPSSLKSRRHIVLAALANAVAGTAGEDARQPARDYHSIERTAMTVGAAASGISST